MIIENFIKRFKAEFEYLEDHEIVDETTKFQELNGWDSLTAIMILEMIDDVFEADISGDELRECVTLGELYNLSKDRSS